MNEEKLITLMTRHFPTKGEFVALEGRFENKLTRVIQDQFAIQFKNSFAEQFKDHFTYHFAKQFKSHFTDQFTYHFTEAFEVMKSYFATKAELFEFKQEFNDFRVEAMDRFDSIDEKLEDISNSTKVLDTLLEQHPIERIERLENHLELQNLTQI